MVSFDLWFHSPSPLLGVLDMGLTRPESSSCFLTTLPVFFILPLRSDPFRHGWIASLSMCESRQLSVGHNLIEIAWKYRFCLVRLLPLFLCSLRLVALLAFCLSIHPKLVLRHLRSPHFDRAFAALTASRCFVLNASAQRPPRRSRTGPRFAAVSPFC